MEPKISNFSVGSTGNKSVTGLLFLPKSIDFWIAQKTGVTENFVHYSAGSCTSTKQMAHSIFWDSSGGKTCSYFDRCVNHLTRESGVITEKIKATWVSFDDNGGGDFGFTLNFTAADANFKIYFKANP